MKKIPYGIANFEKLKENNQYYFVDKTKYIEEIENLGGNFLFYLRPCRFGKSLFLSMLEHYYDINRKDQFEELFSDTYIGKNPTSLRNSFPILKLDFSGISTDKDIEELKHSFNLKIKDDLNSFISKYGHLYKFDRNFVDDLANITDAGDLLNIFTSKLKQLNIRCYLLIDEYDNFTNKVLFHHSKEKNLWVAYKNDFLSSFFATIKIATESRAIDKMFVIGIFPLVLSDVTSGMNIGDNISFSTPFNSMIGFMQSEAEDMLDYYIEQDAIKKEHRTEILAIFKKNYNNYSFSENISEKVYNSDMILYFFNKYFQNKEIPTKLFDEKIRTDCKKLRFLTLSEKKFNDNFSILSNILDKGEIETTLYHSFSLSDAIEQDMFITFLFYLGILTIKENIYGNRYILTIPNEVINTIIVDFIRQEFQE